MMASHSLNHSIAPSGLPIELKMKS